jgi:Prokaryotic homologs of the JAB domain
VADAIRSPIDSVEYPTAYIRGCRGLEDQVREAERKTAYQLQYIGEWHSHPAGHACRPSDDDRTLLTWLTYHMGADGLPGVVVIVGDATVAPYVGSILSGDRIDIHQMART